MPLEMFKSVVDVNLIASFLCTREAFKIFKQQTPTGGS
jgi:NAD(P)-dependent dehydrogenase (short-subunit alcohol dehydrogenase family)